MADLTASVQADASGCPHRLRILGFLLISIVAVWMPVLSSQLLYTPEGVSRNGLITHVLLPTAGVLTTLLIVLIAGRTGSVGGLDLAWFRRSRFETIAVLLLPLVAILLMGLTAAVVNGLGLKWQDDRTFSAEGRRIAFFVAMTINLAVAGPILEEVFWRGYVQRGLERVAGSLPAVVAQAVLFTAVHTRPLAGLAPLFVLGLVTGLWRWRRRTLIPIIAAHMVLNGLYCAAHWPHWLDCTRIRITTDYIAEMDKVVRPAVYDPNTDARACYERACQSVVPMPMMLGQYRGGFPVNWPEETFAQFRRWGAVNETALEYLAEGASKPRYGPVYAGPTAMLAGMPELAGIRQLAFVLDTRIKLRAFDREDDLLAADMATLYRFACHLSGVKVLAHQLMGVGIRTLMAGTIRGILASESLDPQTLAALQQQLEQLADADRNVLDFTLERLVWRDGIQRMFTDDGNGRGRIPRAVITGWDRLPEPLHRLIDPLTPEQNAAFLGLSRQKTTLDAEEFFMQIPTAAARTPWEFHHEPDGVKAAMDRLLRENAYVGLLGSACLGTIELPWRARAEFDALVATIAVIRYEAERGEYPDSLEQLVAVGLLRRVPRDPYSDGPLLYSRGQGAFLLYSCGRDFDDDSGDPSRWGEGPEGGDQLFWPVR